MQKYYFVSYVFLVLFFTSSFGVASMHNCTFIDLTHAVSADIPTWDMSCGYHVNTVCDYKDSATEFTFRVQEFSIKAGLGTHIDAPAHCIEGGQDVASLPMAELISPCVVINVSDRADENYQLSIADIQTFEEKHGEIKPGSFVIVYTGWSRFWDDPQRYHNNLTFPTVSVQAAHLLIERGITGIGIDTLSPDRPDAFFVHNSVLGAGKYIVENIAHADKLPAVGAYSIVMPLKFQGATESPIRLIAVVPARS